MEGKPGLDLRRVAIFTGLGFVWVAPALHTWFAFVNCVVPGSGNKGERTGALGAGGAAE